MVFLLGLSLLNLLMVFGLARTLFWDQLIFWILGLFFFLVGRSISSSGFLSSRLARGKYLLRGQTVVYFLVIFLLLLPLFFGGVVRGSSRWIGIGRFSFQPSEFVKPLLIIFVSSLLVRVEKVSFKLFLFRLILVALPVLMIFIQPDLGSAAVILTTLLLLLFFDKPNLFWWLIIAGSFLPLLFFVSGKFFHQYQMERVTSFFNPYNDPLGRGYNMIQARIAIGSGGWLGRGFGQGRQTQLAYLPEKHTDFIFASIGEELGFLGVLLCIVFYYCFLRYLLKKVSFVDTKFVFYVRLGIFLLLSLQAAINVAMNIGLIPVVGVTLPFISYGGSSLVSSMLCLGLFLGL